MLPVMGQDDRDRGLRVGPGPGFDPGDLAQLGIAPVAGDHEARFERRAVGKGQGRARPVGIEAGREGRHEGQVRAGPRRLGQGFDERDVLDVPAEGVEADLSGPERGRRRPEQAARIVDDAHRLERRRVLDQFRPGPERFQEAHRTVEERNRPTVAARIETADEHRVEPVAGEGERSAQAHGSGTDDGNVIGPLAHGAFTIRLWTVRGLTVKHGFAIADRRTASL